MSFLSLLNFPYFVNSVQTTSFVRFEGVHSGDGLDYSLNFLSFPRKLNFLFMPPKMFWTRTAHFWAAGSPEGCSSRLLRGGSLRSRMFCLVNTASMSIHKFCILTSDKINKIKKVTSLTKYFYSYNPPL